MLSHVVADLSKGLALCFVHRDRIARAEWELSLFYRHSAPWQGEPKHDSREENMPVLRQSFHGDVFLSDVPHHEVQAVQLQFEIAGTPRLAPDPAVRDVAYVRIIVLMSMLVEC